MASTVTTPHRQLISFIAKDAASRDKIHSKWSTLAAEVKAHEQGSIASSYEAFLPAPLPDSNQPECDAEVLGFESFPSKDKFDQHFNHERVQSFINGLRSEGLLVEQDGIRVTELQSTGVGFHTRGPEAESKARSNAAPFLLVVRLKLKDETGVNQALDLLRPLASYVHSSEPATLTYAIYRSSSDPCELVIFERYASQADLTDTHWKSQPFQAFGQQLGEKGIVESKTERTFEEARIGFWGGI